jgi:hypothetical protein
MHGMRIAPYLLALVATMLAAAPAHADTKRFGLTGYTRIIVLGDMVIDIVPSHNLSAVAEGSRAALETLSLVNNDNTLTVSQVAEGAFGPRDGGGGAIRLRLTAQNLREIILRGSGTITVRGLRGGEMIVALDGAGTINANIIAADRLRVRAGGSGTVTLAGRVTTLEASATGSASISAPTLSARDLTLRQTGTGNSSFAASHMASVTATGQANVTVTGRPQCTVNNLGAGTVSCGAGQRAALPTSGEPGLSRDPR